MKIYAIFANDNKKGTTHTLFENAIKAFQDEGHEVDILHLYDHIDEIPFFKHDREHMESHTFYIKNKERFLDADQLLLVFPLYWYSVPGILKAWLDLINAWAYKYEGGVHAKPLHRIKNATIIYSSMQDKAYLGKTLHHPVEQQLSETCKFIGIPHIDIYHVDKVNNLNKEDLSEHIKEIKSICKNCSKKSDIK